MQQNQLRIDQIERLPRRLIDRLKIALSEAEMAIRSIPQNRESLAAQDAVGVEAGDGALRADHFAHQPHHLARPATYIKTVHPGAQADLLEDASGRLFPQQGLD